MWRKALALGMVLMALGVVFGGVVEDSNAGIIYGAYRWHKTGDGKEVLYGLTAGLLGGSFVAGGQMEMAGIKIATEGIVSVALRVGAESLARWCPYIALGIAL
ncbi:hypothetical protein GBV73_02045 [Thermococcus sp. 101 C5]|uniref:hypothetical protein n=1 Tax=Thermococcus TaxID=2263 RepID=UPI00128D37FA|nr:MULTISPECIES: hypothetical protein [Thermococcus]MCA6213507.1 hypothetical protein [Thermococcus bergensis]MPW38482.1 hypothetical protein [Thermococcus sp. 101 C5]